MSVNVAVDIECWSFMEFDRDVITESNLAYSLTSQCRLITTIISRGCIASCYILQILSL